MTPDTEHESRKAWRYLRCQRCGCPDPSHPDSNKYGGVTLVTRTLCLACHDKLYRLGPQRLHAYRTRADSQQRTLTGGYE